MFEFIDAYGDRLTFRPNTAGPGLAVEVNDGTPVHIPLDRLEEVVAGLSDTARQDAAAATTPTEAMETCARAAGRGRCEGLGCHAALRVSERGEYAGVLVAKFEDGGIVLLTPNADAANAALAAYATAMDMDVDFMPVDRLTARWVVFEWQPEDADCSWLMHFATEGDDMAMPVHYLPA